MNPLDELRDIHLPEAVNWWPLAIGWWILAALLLVSLCFFWFRYNRTKKQREMVNHAMESLQQLEADTELDSQEWLQALSGLLRRIVINLHGRQSTAGLVGKQWLSYLDTHSKKNDFSEGAGKILATQPYQEVANYDRKALSGLVRQWVKSQVKVGKSNA